MKYDLSILIPARNEEFLSRTIDDILKNKKGKTEILVGLDGEWSEDGIPQHEDLSVIYYDSSIGQRAILNKLCLISEGRYVMKVDAHCAFDHGFDVEMIQAADQLGPDVTLVPVMRHLHAFDWVCPDGHRRYQSPSGACTECGKPTVKEVVWISKKNPQSTSYRFDRNLVFQYFGEYKKKQVGEFVETMSLQGSCFMITRNKWWELNICDENHGSWGQQGTEVALKTWLSGGRVICNKKTWYAHMFRTQGKDFGFPYPNPGHAIEKARNYSKELFLQSKWDKAKYDIDWLVKKFAPVPGWEDLKKGVVYYTCNTHIPKIDEKCREQLLKSNMPIVSVSLNKELKFGDKQILIEGKKSPLMMHKQILAGLEASDADVVFLCESDVLYHPCHFDFVPKRDDVFYYNENTYKVDYETGRKVFYYTKQVSGLCAYRSLLIEFFKKRIEIIERDGFNRHYEPGQKSTNAGVFPVSRGGAYGSERWMSKIPNVDIRHSNNISKTKWSPEEFRNPGSCQGWRFVDEIPGWEYLVVK